MNGTRFGPELNETGVTFRLWAPAAKRVDLLLDRAQPMHANDGGWYELAVPGARAGTGERPGSGEPGRTMVTFSSAAGAWLT